MVVVRVPIRTHQKFQRRLRNPAILRKSVQHAECGDMYLLLRSLLCKYIRQLGWPRIVTFGSISIELLSVGSMQMKRPRC